jgi:methylenetetrahydrofolate reductase (NADPH)
MRLSERWTRGARPTVSFELYPARDEKAAQSLEKVIDKLAAVSPDFFSVTFGAGGSTREGSYELARALRVDRGLEVLPYLAGYGLGPGAIVEIVDRYRDLGVESLLAVRGDIPRDEPGIAPHPEGPAHASDLLALLSERYAFCLGAAGYPEKHVAAPSPEADVGFLALKVRSGARFVICNYFYDNLRYFDFVERCRAAGIEVPIVPGVMPIFNVKTTENLARICGASIPEKVRAGIAALPEGDKDALSDFGVALALEQCRELLARGAPGLHLYTLDRAKSAVEIVRTLKGEGRL